MILKCEIKIFACFFWYQNNDDDRDDNDDSIRMFVIKWIQDPVPTMCFHECLQLYLCNCLSVYHS